MGTRRALGISAFAQGITFAMNLVNVVVVSRLLTPSEIGVFSVAVSFQAIIHVFREFGVTQYLIQAKAITNEQFRAAFSLTLMFSWTIALILFFGAGPLARFYSHEGVASVLALLAINFILMPFGTPSIGMLRRELRFDSLAFIRIANITVATMVTIAAAWFGQSYLSMAWGAIAGHLTSLLAVSFIRPEGLFMLPSFRGIKTVMRFGSLSSAATLVRELGTSAPDLVLGRTLGFSAVAYYSRAAGLRDMLLGRLVAVVNGVHFPTFAEAIRGGANGAELYTRANGYLIAITVPTMALLALLAEPLILFFFGEQWVVSAPLATLLCLFAVITAPYALANLSLIAGGHVSSVLNVELMVQGARVAALLTSVWLPLERVVPLLGLVAVVEAAAYHYQLKRHYALRIAAMRKPVTDALLLAPMTIAGPYVLTMTALSDSRTGYVLFVYLAASALAAFAGWAAGLFLIGHPLRDELLSLLRRVGKLRWK